MVNFKMFELWSAVFVLVEMLQRHAMHVKELARFPSKISFFDLQLVTYIVSAEDLRIHRFYVLKKFRTLKLFEQLIYYLGTHNRYNVTIRELSTVFEALFPTDPGCIQAGSNNISNIPAGMKLNCPAKNSELFKLVSNDADTDIVL